MTNFSGLKMETSRSNCRISLCGMKRKYSKDPARELFEAAWCGDAVLLDEVLQKMNSSERTSALETKMDVYYRGVYSTPLELSVENESLDCVKVLLKYKPDIEGRGSCGYTPLFVAAIHGNLDVLRCLVENGADVNARTNDNCSPLMIASENGHLNAVSFLIEHGASMQLQDKYGQTALHYAVRSFDVSCCLIKNGADVNSCTNENRTPLMIASCWGCVKLVAFLVEHGADMDLQDTNGDTALHFAVNLDVSEVVYKLLSLGASQLRNSQGLTPLYSAINKGEIFKVEDLITRPECTKKQRIDALELLGACLYIEQNIDPSFQPKVKGFECMKRGMKERFADPSHPLLKLPMEPVEAYQNRKESQSLEELTRIEGDVSAILIESLLIKERILGTNNAGLLLLPSIRKVADYLTCEHDMYGKDSSICKGLYNYAIKIAKSCNQSAISDLYSLTCVHVDEMRGSVPPKQKDFLELLEQIVLEYKKPQKLGKEKGLLFDCLLELQSFIPRLEHCEQGKILLRKLFCINPRDDDGDTLLHRFGSLDVWKIGQVPCTETVKVLLNAGLDVNAINSDGDTPLHRAVTFIPCCNNNVHLLTDMLEVLLAGGAHHDFVNNDGKTAMDMAKTDEARRILSQKRKLELKCISARAVKKFGLPYLGVVPRTLERYISMH